MNEEKNKKKSKVEIIEFKDLVNSKKEAPKISVEDSKEIRKKLTMLLMGMLIFAIIVAIILVTNNTFTKKPNKTNTTKSEATTTTEIKEEINEPPEGNIKIDDLSIEPYKNIITINQYDVLYNPKLTNLFESDINDINQIDNINKLYLASKSQVVTDYLKSAGINEHEQECNVSGDIEIPANIMYQAMLETFGSTITYQNEDFYYSKYLKGMHINTYKLSFSNGIYNMKCILNNNNINIVIQEKISEINNQNNILTFKNQVVFITKNGVYQDPTTKKLITNDRTREFNSYIKEGINYKFIFTKEQNTYHLSAIKKQL